MSSCTPQPEPPYFACLLWLAACGPQASTEYRGEPLLSMSGRVELALQGQDASALLPALAFIDQQERFHIVEVEVEGEFPAGFTLDVYEKPPGAAFTTASEHLPGEPQLAFGYITAVTPDHPEVIENPVQHGSGSLACADDVSCSVGTVTTEDWCTRDGECYRETTSCPPGGSLPEECEFTTEGDPALKRDMWDSFAGLSENYGVVYLRDPARPRSWTAQALGARDTGLAAGYHVIAIEPGSEERDLTSANCRQDAAELAAERYNERHGTAWSAEQLASDECGQDPMPCTPDGSFCGSDFLPCPPDVIAEFERTRELILVDLDCPLTFVVLRPVEDLESERVSVRIDPDARPITDRAHGGEATSAEGPAVSGSTGVAMPLPSVDAGADVPDEPASVDAGEGMAP